MLTKMERISNIGTRNGEISPGDICIRNRLAHHLTFTTYFSFERSGRELVSFKQKKGSGSSKEVRLLSRKQD